jgi:hypothetical protein
MDKLKYLNLGIIKEMNRIIAEILNILADAETGLSSQEIAVELKMRGIKLEPRTVRYHLTKLEKIGLIRKGTNGKRIITKRGLEELRQKSVFERLGEFSERIEYNIFFCTFDIYTLKGTVPTNVAIIDKKHSDRALEILSEISDSTVLISNLIAVADENENFGGIMIPKGKFGIATISNTIYDVMTRSAGVFMTAEYAGLLHFENFRPQGFTELISYAGTTLSPGWLFLKSGLTSVYRAIRKGRGETIIAIRSFSKHAVDIVIEEIGIAKTKGIGGVISISYPSDRVFSLPPGTKARLIVSAGLNYLAPLHELGLDVELRINEAFIDFREFKSPEEII